MTVNGVSATGKETDETIAAGAIGNTSAITSVGLTPGTRRAMASIELWTMTVAPATIPHCSRSVSNSARDSVRRSTARSSCSRCGRRTAYSGRTSAFARIGRG